jgi:mRNA-degrading endonuclease RelE of RelBE toxin-antitoxin system
MAHISLSAQKQIFALKTPTFDDQYKELSNQYKQKMDDLIKEITQDPLNKSELMMSVYKGLRKKKKGRIRILYTYCKDCRGRGDDSYRACDGCNKRNDDTIIFFYVGLKGIIYKDD